MPSVPTPITVLAMVISGIVARVIGGVFRLVASVVGALWSLGIFLAVAVAVRLGEVIERTRHSR